MIPNIAFRTIMLKGEAGNSIESIEKLSASGGVMQMRITFTDGSVYDFPVNDAPDEDLIHNIVSEDTQDIRDEIDEITTVKEITLAAANWSAVAPYTNQITVEGVAEGDDYEIVGFTPTLNDTTNANVKEALGYITYGLVSDNQMLFVACTDKPLVNLPLVLRKIVKGA